MAMNVPERVCLHLPLASLPMGALLLAQFTSALADNALFVTVLVLVKGMQSGRDLTPLVQEFFAVAFILLAPIVGPFSDSLPKGRVMFLSNAIKLLGAGFILAGGHPLLGYGLVGVGAAAYSPAKYGILTQFFDPARLVKANGWLEGSTIVAILLGVVAGGLLADRSLSLALWGVTGLYALAAAFNLLIPRLPPERPLAGLNVAALGRDFGRALSTLFRHPDARFSLLGTGLFWGCGATLRIALFAWVPATLMITDNGTPANLMAAVSVGIVFGAAAAGLWVKLATVNRALIGGLLLGPLILSLAWQQALMPSVALLVAIGAAGGFFIVPLNALLQETGHESVGAGRALAVQNFVENLGMAVMVGLYFLVSDRINAPSLVSGFGAVVLAGVLALSALRARVAAHRA
jgi:MFS transporter, LPLT family, lysophospholipid transporter